MSKHLVKIQLRRRIIPADLGEEYIVNGLSPLESKNATITVLDNGDTVVTWLERVPGWKLELHEWIKAVVRGGFIILIIFYFWTLGAAVFLAMGVI